MLLFSSDAQRLAAPPASTGGRAPWWRAVPLHWIVLAAVAVLLVVLTLIPAADALRPVRAVHVAAALPARTAEGEPTQAMDITLAQDAGRSTRSVQAPGWLEPDPYYTAVTALADGVVQTVDALEGESVEAGQVVATLVAEDAELALRRAQAELATARARVLDAQAARAAAQTDWDEPVERRRSVATAQAALAEAEAQLAQQPAMVRQAEATLRRCEQALARGQQAVEGNTATDRERIITPALEVMRLRERVLEANVARLAAEHTAAKRAAEVRVEERLALDGANARLADAQAAAALAEAVVDEAQLRYDRMVIRAPMDGRVLKRIKSPGDKVMLGMDDPHSAHILHLYDPALIQVRVDVPLADASQVYVGQRCEVVVDVLPDEVFKGEVTRITHEADLQKNTLQVKVRVIDPSPLLRPEMLTRVRFLAAEGAVRGGGDGTGMERTAVRVPGDAIDGDRVWVVRQRRGLRGAVDSVPVSTIRSEGQYALVSGDLRPGDLLVTEPSGLTAGERVRFAAPEGATP